MSDKPPFIASQSFYLLDAQVPDPRSYLKPGVFRQPDESLRRTDKREGFDDPWEPISRHELFLQNSIPRLCLTTDAGLGKTTTLEWAEQQMGRERPDSLALLLEMRHLPDSRRLYLQPAADGSPALLVETFRARGGLDLDEETCQRMLRKLIAQRRFTLLVDAIDQTSVEENVDRRLRELRKFIEYDLPEGHVVIAGRPYAVLRYFDELFADGDWRFAQVAPFTQEQQQEYLGAERSAHLSRLDVEVLSVPRALETVRSLEVSRLRELRTAADVYWLAAEKILEKAFAVREVRREGFTIDSARWLLSVLAFEMAREGNFAEVPQDDMPRFRRHVWQQHRDHCDWESQADFNRQLQLLGKLNVFMEYAVSDHSELQDICWKNRSLQEFFAGLWLARYAPEADRPWIRQAIYLPDDKVTAELYWMWRFAAEMPATGRSATCWVHSMAPLYDPGDGTAQGTRRSTEMLYRSWSTMQAYACAGGKVADMADRLLGGFQAEFPEILAGSRGPDAQRIAEDFLKQFQPIPPAVESAAALHFRMGSPPTEAERYADKELYETAVPRQFELACYPVTNQQYELFHPSHRERRDEYSSDDRCPVVWVTWYDAWAFCHWLGPSYRLPSEKEWEFACRAGSTTPFHFGDALTSTQANFDGNYPYGGAPKGPYLRRTTAVGSYPPNAWKLYDMHGNVWEWCDTWYDASAAVSDDPKHFGSARVLRGGSWLGNAGYARSAFRLDWRPSLSVNYGGFRVARALG